MIRFDHVTFTYPDRPKPVLERVELSVGQGELALVIGETGTGKSTLLKCVNGLVPRFTGGTLAGRVVVDSRDTSRVPVREMAPVVGYVLQDPASAFVATTVEEELAYTMEQLGLDPPAMRRRVEETLDLMGLAPLRHRPLRHLSGGEAQRVAIGSVLTAHPRVMVMDEPTSALDPGAAEDVLAAVTRLVHDVGITVLMAEHRLERVVQYADLLVHLDAAGHAMVGDPKTVMEHSSVAPPVVHLGRLLGWSPPPLSVRDARRRATALHRDLPEPPARPTPAGKPLLKAERLTVTHGSTTAVGGVSLELAEGEIAALMGRNGAGKSSLLWAVQGSGPRSGGKVEVDGVDPAGLDPGPARNLVGLVPHQPSDMLFMETVADECQRADPDEAGRCAELVHSLLGEIDPNTHPADLSEGQKLGLVLAIQLAAQPRVLLLDEPTRGLDYSAKERLARVLASAASSGTAVLVATHDVEFSAAIADRVLVMADGELVADGPAPEILAASPLFAPQVSKVLGRWLTVDEVARALERSS